MGKALRTLIVGLLFASILAACGGTDTAQTPTATTVAAVEATQATEPTVAAEPTTVATEEATVMAEETATEEATVMAEETATEEATAMVDETATTEATATAEETATVEAGGAGGVTLPEVDAGTVTGDIIAAGSSTVYPLAERMAERFTDEGYSGNITIDSIGSGAGIERFCVAAETDIATASRAINDEEKQQCTDKGREAVEFRVGTDALAVVVSSENDFLTELSLEQLAQVYSGEAKTWADVDASYPAEAIQLFSPGTDSGTFDYFVEAVFDEDDAPILAANPQLSENDNVLVQGVQGSPYAIGYFGYAYFNENKDTLKALSIDGVEPTAETAEDNSYPLSRPLFIYSAKTIMDEKPQVASFINFFLSSVNDEIIDVGYFPASDDALNEAKQNWATATGQATSGGSAAAVTLPEVDAGTVTGDIIAAGSFTVYPLAERMAERFTDEGYSGNITIDSIGSGAGIERFCVAAETDIATASRAINDEEKQQCTDKGREAVEFRVGTDALAVVVSSENDFLTELSLEQLAQVYSGEAKTWADVDASYPAEAIQLFSPGTDSGTFDYFVEAVFDEDDAPILAANPQLSENDNVLVQGVQGSPYAIGYFGYAYFNENKDTLKALSIDGVEPTAETAEDNSYPLSRPLFIYSAKTIMDEKPQVASFINFFLSSVNDEIIDVGYFPASDDALNEAKQNWTTAGE